MSKNIKQLFTSLGLSDSETKIYLASLGLGPTSVQEIAKKAKLSRTAAYDSIKSLQLRGLMSTFTRGKKRFFTAEDPEAAALHFKENIVQMQGQLETLNKAIPEIKMMTGGEKPAVRFFEGKEALYALFSDVAKVNPKTFDEITNLDDVDAYMDKKALLEARKVFDNKRIKTRILHRGSIRKKDENIEFCELKKSFFADFHGDIMIYGNHIALVTFVGKIVLVIVEHNFLADTMRVLFEAAWGKSNK